VAAIAVAPNKPNALQTVTFTLSAFAATTAYSLSINNPQGHVASKAFTTDGSVAATVTFVPQTAGLYTVNAYSTAPPASVASATFQSGQK